MTDRPILTLPPDPAGPQGPLDNRNIFPARADSRPSGGPTAAAEHLAQHARMCGFTPNEETDTHE